MGKNCIVVLALVIIFACFPQAAVACEPQPLTQTGTLLIKFNNQTGKSLLPFSCFVYQAEKGESSKTVYQNNSVTYKEEITLEDIPQGEYVVSVCKLSTDCEAQPRTITVLAGKQTVIQLDIKNVPIGTLNIIAYDNAAGINVSGAIIQVYYNSKVINTVTTDLKNTNTALSLPIGEYTLRVKQAPQGYKADISDMKIQLAPDKQATAKINFVRLAPNGKTVFMFTCLSLVLILFVVIWCYCKNKK